MGNILGLPGAADMGFEIYAPKRQAGCYVSAGVCLGQSNSKGSTYTIGGKIMSI